MAIKGLFFTFFIKVSREIYKIVTYVTNIYLELVTYVTNIYLF